MAAGETEETEAAHLEREETEETQTVRLEREETEETQTARLEREETEETETARLEKEGREGTEAVHLEREETEETETARRETEETGAREASGTDSAVITEVRDEAEDQGKGLETEPTGVLLFRHRLWKDRSPSAAKGKERTIIRKRISAGMRIE